jgi:hypothetical protein
MARLQIIYVGIGMWLFGRLRYYVARVIDALRSVPSLMFVAGLVVDMRAKTTANGYVGS